jgi:hypothetical protein
MALHTLKNIVAHDFPTRWPELLPALRAFKLTSSNIREVHAGCVGVTASYNDAGRLQRIRNALCGQRCTRDSPQHVSSTLRSWPGVALEEMSIPRVYVFL